ncbi:MAG: GntR family transcriptional regulator, partial [Myxococcota bacterium]
ATQDPVIVLHLSETSGLPFYRQIEDQIAELIHTGQLEAGTRLPSVRELAAQTLVSVVTIRRAYEDLDRAGLIVRRQGQGTFVADDSQAASAVLSAERSRDELRDVLRRAQQRGIDRETLRGWCDELLDELDP